MMPGGKIITIGSEPAITQTFESAQEDVEWRAAGRDAVKMFDGDPLSGPFDEPDNELVMMMRSGTPVCFADLEERGDMTLEPVLIAVVDLSEQAIENIGMTK